jgi:hypothetical protein
MVESATGRYRSALDALAEYLPLVVIDSEPGGARPK